MLDIDVSLLMEIVSVLVLMAILNSMLYKPIRRLLEERAARMSAIESDVEKYERNAHQLVENFNRKLAEARKNGQTEKEALKQQARDEEKGLLEASTKEAEATKQAMLSELGGQIEAARKDLSAQAETFASQIAEKLLGRAV